MLNSCKTELRVATSAPLSGLAIPPSSKSETIRALLFALLAKGKSTILTPLAPTAQDVASALQVIRTLGAEVSIEHDRFIVESPGIANSQCDAIHTGNSGITTRFIMPMLGLRKNALPLALQCGSQMQERPNQSLIEALQTLGMSVQAQTPTRAMPLTISGHLQGGEVTLSGLTSQYLSALLIALPCAPSPSTITVANLRERPYVDMTLYPMIDLAAAATASATKHFTLAFITADPSAKPAWGGYATYGVNTGGDFETKLRAAIVAVRSAVCFNGRQGAVRADLVRRAVGLGGREVVAAGPQHLSAGVRT